MAKDKCLGNQPYDTAEAMTKSDQSIESYVRGWFPKPPGHPYMVSYAANFWVPSDFGCPGPVLITNFLRKEFQLMEIVVHGFKQGPIFSPADTWIRSRKLHPSPTCIAVDKLVISLEHWFGKGKGMTFISESKGKTFRIVVKVERATFLVAEACLIAGARKNAYHTK